MRRLKICTIVGARPQFVKAAAVSRAIAKWNSLDVSIGKIEEYIVHTGQHYDFNMSEVFFQDMGIPWPSKQLEIGGKGHGEMIGQALSELEKYFLEVEPDVVLVYGDTNSTLAGALAAVKLHIPVAHVEAGLRSYNDEMPEEINRVLTDKISRWLFCSSQKSVDLLTQDKSCIGGASVHLVGDVMYDAILYTSNQLVESTEIEEYDLVTVHRQENTDNPSRLREILSTLDNLAQKRKLVLPLHPRTRKRIQELNISIKNITLVDPVGYKEMVRLISGSRFVITDSGGLQKEAYFLKKPCITIRDETEWVELIDHKVNLKNRSYYFRNKKLLTESFQNSLQLEY